MSKNKHPAIQILVDRVKKLEEEAESLKLSANPEDWKKGYSQNLVIMGHWEAISILRQFLDDEEPA